VNAKGGKLRIAFLILRGQKIYTI